MARKTARPGRTLAVFFLGLAIAFGLVALAGNWKPELGLDLQGGTSIRLTPKGNPSAEALGEARKIIDQRVNGSGVTEAEVTVQGNRFIVVEIPGDSRRDLVDTVKRQAQLRFRVVACSDSNPGPCATGGGATPQDPTSPDPGTGVTAPPTAAPSDTAAPSGAASPSGSANRAPANYSADGETPPPSDGGSPSTEPSAGPTPTGVPLTPAPEGGPDVGDPLKWMDNPNQEAIDAFNSFQCPQDGTPVNVEDDPEKPLVSCEWDPESQIAQKYLLSAALIEGTELDSADAVIPQNEVNYVVSLDFNGSGTEKFTKISEALVGTEKQFAIVLDGQVLSAPTMEALITNGQAQISGNFTQASAKSLATSLKYGALPVAFSDFSVETVGPSLAGDQLTAGITAGLIGLLVVMIYCLIYYRGLGIVVVGSLLVAGAATYAMVLLLSETANFTLTLPGIAGLIVAVGITADSFIVYFERIRDEMRDGKSMRVAVEAGWVRARATCLAADAVSLLAAIVLYIFAAGVVRGFAFALGLSTLIDLVVFFWFTKPLVSVLARYKFFNGGGKLSGLSPESLGIDKVTPDRPRVAAATRAGTAPKTAQGGTA
jgi:preprotein translocase subunit SecD